MCQRDSFNAALKILIFFLIIRIKQRAKLIPDCNDDFFGELGKKNSGVFTMLGP